MTKQHNSQKYNTSYQLKLPVEISTIIEISDPVYTFCEVMDCIDLRKHLAVKESKTGRKRYNPLILLKVILFAFMEKGYVSLREIEKLCKTDIRFMWLLQSNDPPSHMTIDNFMNETLLGNIEDIFAEINGYIFLKTFEKITMLLTEINREIEALGIKFGTRTEYAVEYMEQITEQYIKLTGINPETIIRGKGHHKTAEQRRYDKLNEYTEKFNKTYGKYPKYPVADAGYGSFNNYLYCEEHGMEKYMKFTMFKKETEDSKYRDNPYRAVNFPINENGNPVCPNGKEFTYLYSRPVKGNKYGRREELYQCEDCTNCPHKERCCKCEGNRVIRLNEELTEFHKEVLSNLNSVHGALLRMNRSIQAEGAFGTIKWNKSYQRIRRRGLKSVILEIAMISCGFNLHKYHLKSLARQLAA